VLGAIATGGLLTTVLVAVPLASTIASASPPAAYTTTDVQWMTANEPGTAASCLNGSPDANGDVVNCNIYPDADAVWLNGGPTQSIGGTGDYFFAVLDPGGQANPNDLTSDLLSTDSHDNRTFHVDGSGNVTYLGTHAFDQSENKIQLSPYNPTLNPGGVYILAICSLSGGYPVNPSECKYDAFKVNPPSTCTSDCGVVPGADPTVTKTADGAYIDTFAWGITKAVDKTKVNTSGSTATFNYTVDVTHDGGTISGVSVTGLIDVNNPNFDSSFNTSPVILDSVTDQLSDQTNCSVDTSGTQTVTVNGGQVAASSLVLNSFDNYFPYTCTLAALPQGELDNTATAYWSAQTLSNNDQLADGSADFTFFSVAFTGTNVHQTIVPTDTFGLSGTTGVTTNLCVLDPTQPCTLDATTAASPVEYKYSRTVNVTKDRCVSYTNTAVTTTGPSDSKTVTVCGPVAGGLTMGFWQNKNGQGIITSGATTSGVCNSGTYLRTYNPFQNLSSTATCAAVASYVTTVIKAANAGGASMNAMLKAQMLSTALDVFFSTPGNDKVAAFNGGNTVSLGGVNVDLTKVCNMLDGSGGSGACSGTYGNTAFAFGGTPTCQTVSQLLTYAASQSNPGGTIWYNQVKATQGLAKNTFDAINNQAALTC
jgi:hypothetical protein